MKYSKNQAILASVFVITLVLSPVFENWASKPKDSFPLSYYPMFSMKRASTYGMYYFVGYDDNQNRYKIPYKLIGTGGFNQVRRQIKKKARSNRVEAFTHQVGERISKKKSHPYVDLVNIELVKGFYHLENYFLKEDTIPVHERIIATYKIERP